MSRAMGVRLQYAPAEVRALVVAALREKADNLRHFGRVVRRDGKREHAEALGARALLADIVADELEGV